MGFIYVDFFNVDNDRLALHYPRWSIRRYFKCVLNFFVFTQFFFYFHLLYCLAFRYISFSTENECIFVARIDNYFNFTQKYQFLWNWDKSFWCHPCFTKKKKEEKVNFGRNSTWSIIQFDASDWKNG